MNQILPLSAAELLALAFICICFGVSLGLLIASWIAGRTPSTDRRGTGHAPGPGNPPLHDADAPRLTAIERGRFRN